MLDRVVTGAPGVVGLRIANLHANLVVASRDSGTNLQFCVNVRVVFQYA
jgi:hypothetical protein